MDAIDWSALTRDELDELSARVQFELALRTTARPARVSVCGRECPCFYKLPTSLTSEAMRELGHITFDSCALLVHGLSDCYDWRAHRAQLFAALGKQNRCRRLRVTRDCTMAFLHFDDHNQAAAAQQVLLGAHFCVNFVLKPESMERMKAFM